MPLRDLIGERRTVEMAGRRFHVRRPTVRTFFLALEIFGREIGLIRSASQKSGGLSRDVAIALFLTDPGHPRLARLLETCVKAESGNLREALAANTALAVDLASAAADMIDPERVQTLLGPPVETDVVGPAPDVDDGVLLVIGCAERLHIDPLKVMDWPVGFFADVVRAFSRPSQSDTVSGFMPEGTATYKAARPN